MLALFSFCSPTYIDTLLASGGVASRLGVSLSERQSHLVAESLPRCSQVEGMPKRRKVRSDARPEVAES